jgi:sugar lactone lactonase YvrE
MSSQKVDCIFNGICHLGEGPVWKMQTQQLFWTDIYQRRIWVYDPATQQSRIFWEGVHQVGGFAFTRTGGLVLCTDHGVFLLSPDQVSRLPDKQVPRLLFNIPLAPAEMFNDITVDPAGRIFAGTLDRKFFTGTLYRLEKSRQAVPILTNVRCSNGMTFSMDEKFFFHTDSLRHAITRYDYDLATGEIGRPMVFYQGDESQGLPDGITLDTEDHLWVAFWGASVVRRLNPSRKIVEEIPVPAKQPSSVMFGGTNLTDLYITSACEGAADITSGYDEKGVFLGGPLYRYRASVQGRSEWLADFE